MKHETILPYSPSGEKRTQVEAMFNNIAPTYDALNHRLSAGIDRWWRRRVVGVLRAMSPRPARVLDIATGTGDLAIAISRALKPESVIGVDIADGMLDIARRKAPDIRFMQADATALPFTDAAFDAVTAAFGIRNFQDLEAGLREMARVLRSGGTLCMIELTEPVGLLRKPFQLYSHTVLPALGSLISHDRKAYQYLTRTIEAFPQGEQMTTILRRAGFRSAQFRRLTAGICTLYIAQR